MNRSSLYNRVEEEGRKRRKRKERERGWGENSRGGDLLYL
jgi:hypothetical protein